jgi:plasmid stabilization system protein ParE
MAVVWASAAARGIERAYDYIFDFNPRAAMHVADALRAEGNSLVDFPHRGRLGSGNRYARAGDFLPLYHPISRHW